MIDPEFRRLHPIKEGNRKYRFTLTRDVKVRLTGSLVSHPDCDFIGSDGRVWASIINGCLTVKAEYSWNGCNPKTYVGIGRLGKWVGTPDFPQTIMASLYHDVFFQFSYPAQYELYDVNLFFYRCLCKEDFVLADQYYFFVRKYGHLYFRRDQTVNIKYYEHQ